MDIVKDKPQEVNTPQVLASEKPGYWAVLPAAVRYDPEVSSSAKLLYAEISALTGAAGYCYATNEYFSRLYGLTERTIIRLIRELGAAGWIRVEDDEGGRRRRKIYAGLNPLAGYPDKNVTPTLTKMSPPPDKNVTPIKNKKEDHKPPKAPQGAAWEPEIFERFWKAYPKQGRKDKTSARREWDRLKPDRKLMLTMSAALARAKTSDEWLRGIGIPYACRWLRNRRWEEWAEEEAEGGADQPVDRSLPGEQW